MKITMKILIIVKNGEKKILRKTYYLEPKERTTGPVGR